MTPRSTPGRRASVGLFLGLLLAGALCVAGSCTRGPDAPEVVLYSSMDGQVLQPLLDEFTRTTGIRVLLVGDTEATKSTGLLQRVLSERARPRADVFWSSEPLALVRLGREGLLQPRRSDAAEARIAAVGGGVGGGGWPADMRAGDFSWYALAPRVRVVVSNSQVAPNPALTNLDALTGERFKGRIGMARPQFGTTRAHMSALLAYCGQSEYRRWLTGLRDNGLRLYDGNSAVVRAAARGEILLGLTDSDDVFAGQRNGWHVAMHLPYSHLQPWHYAMPGPSEFPYGALRIPGTVGLIRGAPHPDAAGRLIDYILSAGVEDALAKGEWRSLRVGAPPGPDDELARRSCSVDLERISQHEDLALAIFDEVMQGPAP